MKSIALATCAFATWMVTLQAQQRPPAIASISICSPTGTGGQGSCPSGTLDTHQIVLGPGGSGSVNSSGLGVAPTPDEHSTVFGPGELGNNQDYLFFVASTESNPGIGVAVLSGGSGPNKSGQWVLDYPKVDGYGSYSSGFGQVFNAAGPLESCPPIADGNPAHQDPTFDLNYAAPGSVVKDPTAGPGSLLMVFEGTNACIGSAGGTRPGTGSYASLAIATSLDYGKTWPTYRGTSTFSFVPLPNTNHNQGPNAPLGATGAKVCTGNDCSTTPAASYGRYVVVTEPTSITSLIAAGKTLDGTEGEQEISGFVDDVAGNAKPYLYVNSGGGPRVARAQLNGGTAPLTFLKWNGTAFAAPGIGGADTNILPSGPFQSCEGTAQLQYGSSISYVEDTQQYLLVFVCDSPGDPAIGPGTGSPRGAAWFYSTSYDLSDQTQWTVPKEIPGSWSVFDQSGGCADFKGFYPTLMSLGKKTGHLSLTGYVFYLWGCQTGGTPSPGRQFSARAFTITTQTVPLITKVANAEGESPTIAPNTWTEIKGSNLAPAGDTRVWQGPDFVNNQLPTQLDGVSVTVNGKAAFVYYISPTQINILTPPDALPASPQVVVTNNGSLSASFTAQAQSISPSFFVFDSTHVAAVHLNGDLVGAASLSVPGFPFSPAKPGEIIQIYANGFGPTSTSVVSGSLTQGGTLSPLPVVKIGGITATVQFAGLVFPGEYQFNVVIPQNAPAGDQSIVATYNGAATQAGTVITIAGTVAPTTITLYVAPSGKDSWSGTLPAPNAANSDGPFATLDRARAAVQSLNKTGLTQVTVQLRGGTYYLPATEQFSAADSGAPNLKIAYQNYPGESPVISGGMRVQNWTSAGVNLWKATLPAGTQYFENLYYNGTRRLRPRLGGPLGAYYRIANTIYLKTAAPPAVAPDPNCAVYIQGSGWECFDRFQYDPKDPVSSAWKNLAPAADNPCGQAAGNTPIAGDIELLVWEQFTTSKLRIRCVDSTNHIVYLTGPTGFSQNNSQQDGFIPGNRYLIENVQDELVQTGQWFLDRSVTPWTLTYLANAGENPNTDEVIIPQLPQLLVASGLQYVTFQGLTFEHDNYIIPPEGHKSMEQEPETSAAVSFQNSSNITFDGGVVAHTSGAGLEFLSCLNQSSPVYCASNNPNAVTSNNVVENSAFYDVGALGIRIGDPYSNAHNDANVPQSTTVQNNVVEGYGRTLPASFGIGQGFGHDNLYTHNDVYDGYHCAVSIASSAGNDLIKPNGIGNANNTISFNHVWNLLQGIMNDGGSIRIAGGNNAYTAPGNKILNNKIHDVSDASALDSNGYGGDGIYMDNQTGLVTVENNLVYRVSGNAIYSPQGPAAPNEANVIHNNILAYARQSMVAVNFPYPHGVPTSIPEVFNLSNNLFYYDRSSTSSPPRFYVQGGCLYAGGAPFTQFQQWNSNLYWRTDGGFASDAKAFAVQPNASNGQNAPCSGDQNNYTFYSFSGWQKLGEDTQSVVQNPGFANPAYPSDDYSLPKGSPGVGFIPFDTTLAGRTNPLIKPPAVPATFPTKSFNPATDY